MKRILLLLLLAFTVTVFLPEAGAAPAWQPVAKAKAVKKKKHRKHRHRKHRRHRRHVRKVALNPAVLPVRQAAA
ncbi:MAG: hypothetical protein EPO07_14660 [Verrucomicrobia bacterium]|nr:MAG: hypothetical protein EPO07_14660 [Verrucomicrobiota bacterium]